MPEFERTDDELNALAEELAQTAISACKTKGETLSALMGALLHAGRRAGASDTDLRKAFFKFTMANRIRKERKDGT